LEYNIYESRMTTLFCEKYIAALVTQGYRQHQFGDIFTTMRLRQTPYLFFWNGHSYNLYIWGVSGLCHVLTCQRQITLKGSVAPTTISEFWDPHHISEMVAATDLKFGMCMEYTRY